MKKRISILVALSMLFGFSASMVSANTDVYYDVNYEQISVASGDLTKLAKEDTFYAVVSLKGATDVGAASVALTWNNDVVTPIKSAGDVATSYKNCTNSRIDTAYTYTVEEENDDGDMVSVTKNAFADKSGSDAFKLDAATGSYYLYYAFGVNDPDHATAYSVDTNGQVIMKVRFKVVGEGDAGIKADTADTLTRPNYAKTSAAAIDPVTVKVTPLTIGSSAPVVPPVTYDGEAKGAFSFEVGPKYAGNEGFKVFFKETNTDTKAETTKYAEVAKPAVFDDQTTIESGMTVDLGVKVSGVPSNVVLELLRAEWLETLRK